MPRKKAESKALVTMESLKQQMIEEAQKDSERVGSGGGSTRLTVNNRSGNFVLDEIELENEIDVIIVNFSSVNQHFDRKYDEDNPCPPACAAIGLEDNESLNPFEDSPKPVNDVCETCEFNDWGSAEVGKGKMCRQSKKLMILPSDFMEDEKAEPVLFNLPPTSVSSFNKLVRGVNKKIKKTGTALHGMVVTMSTEEHVNGSVTYHSVNFKPLEAIAEVDELLKVIELREEVVEELLEPIDFSDYTELQPKKRTRKPAGGAKAAPKKKAAATTAPKKKSRFSK